MTKKIKAAERKKINARLTDLTTPGHKTVYFDVIPLKAIEDILSDYGYNILQEDNTEWSGFLCGNDSSCYIDLGIIDTGKDDNGLTVYDKIDNTVLSLSWYKMTSGRYEITCYLSL